MIIIAKITEFFNYRNIFLQFWQNIFDNATVEQVDDAVGVACVTLRVCHHDDCCAFFV